MFDSEEGEEEGEEVGEEEDLRKERKICLRAACLE